MPFRSPSPNRKSDPARTALIIICIIVLITGGIYTLHWTINKSRIERQSEQFSAMYVPAETPVSMSPTKASPEVPVVYPEPTHQPSLSPSAKPGAMPTVKDVPIPTPDSDTLVFSLETPPPIQESFTELLACNPETVGFLRVGSIVSLPVVQRKNDNDFYLNHTFDGKPSAEGTLFLDGLNALVPEDDCLIVYGHNMNNGTMFGNLRQYQNLDYFRSCPPVSFDTIYENRTYIPFAAFSASMDKADSDYFNVRRFLLTPGEFDEFVSNLKKRSDHSVPVDVQYGDKLLLLVTCDYSNNDGRFIVALREMRSDESLAAAKVMIAAAKDQ